MTNFIQEGEVLPVVVTHPTVPASGDPVRFGSLTGVAVTNEGEGGCAATETMVKFDEGVYDVSVAAVDDNGNSAVAVGDTIYFVDGDSPHLSKKAAGYAFGHALEAITSGSTDTIKVRHCPPPGVGTTPADASVSTAKIIDSNVTAGKLSATLKTGFIPLNITTARLLTTNAIANTVEGYVPDGNTSPSLSRVNGATDKALRLAWAGGAAEEITFAPIVYPPDLDDASEVSVHFLAAMAGATDHPPITVGYFEGVGDTNAGGDTTHVIGTSISEVSVAIAAGDVGATPKCATICVTPGTHANDAMYIYAAWVEYTRA
jgi:predicted RecA/RadA family phage recombinase